MERYTMFLDGRIKLWKWLYYPKQSTDSMQCLIIINGILHKTRTKNLKICMEAQKTQNSQRNLEKGKRSWRNQSPWCQTILQGYSHQNCMVLAQIQQYKSIEQDRKPRNKTTHLWSPNLWQRRQEYTMEKRQPIQ